MTNDRADLNFLNRLLRRMQDFCARRKLIEPGALVIAAVSGGADSLALLDMLWRWRVLGGEFTLAGAHYNHRLRPEADSEQQLVESLFNEYRIPYFIESGDVKGQAQASQRTEHDIAREMRYNALLKRGWKLQEELTHPPDKPALIATGHHRDDQVETVLLRLFQGADLSGLAGIRPRLNWHSVAEGVIIRPLLEVSRVDLEKYCRIRKLPVVTDQSNFDQSYPRNRIRHSLKPVIMSNFGESAWNGVARIAEWMEERNSSQKSQILSAIRDSILTAGKKEVVLDYNRFHSYLDTVQLSVLRQSVELLADQRLRIPTTRFLAVLRFLNAKATGICELGQGVNLTIGGGRIYVFRRFTAFEPTPANVDGSTTLPPEWGDISIRLISPEAAKIPPPAGMLFVDADRISQLQVKPAAPGDRIILLGMSHARKISDILSELGVPLHRRSAPLLWDQDEIVAIPGCRIAERVKVTSQTRRAYEITGSVYGLTPVTTRN